MGFLKPKAPAVVTAESVPAPTPATPAIQADASTPEPTSIKANPGSMISTSSQGLTRKARTVKPSLVGASIAS